MVTFKSSVLAACNLWTRRANTAAENGVFYGWYTESDCMGACLTSSNCVAFDLGPVGCVLHYNAQDLTTSYHVIGFTQVLINRHCLPTSPSPLRTESSTTTTILEPSTTSMSERVLLF